MDKIGLAFCSKLTADEVQGTYIGPLRKALQNSKAGFYSNYLHQVDPDDTQPTEHLLVFEVHDFKQGLRLLRTELEKIGLPGIVQFQNLNPSSPGY